MKPAGRATFTALFLLAMLTCPSWSLQEEPAECAKSFAGTWDAMFKDKPFMTLKLKCEAPGLTGTMTDASVTFDDKGDLSSVEAIDETSEVVDTKPEGKLLLFKVKDKDDGSTTGFELKLTGTDEAELMPLPQGIRPAIHPWKMKRQPLKDATDKK